MTNREDGYMADHCTNWADFDVPTIWSTVSDEGDAVSYTQVTAWRETSEAIDKQAATLRAARDELMGGWPPEKSTAAQEFFDQVDAILAAMDYHSGAAATNSAALHGILMSLSDVQSKIKPIYDEWSTRTATQNGKSRIDKAIDTLTFWSNENAWQSTLRRQASKIMIDSDASVSEHRQQMSVPDPYVPPQDGAIQPNTGSDNHPGSISRKTPSLAAANSQHLAVPPLLSTSTSAAVLLASAVSKLPTSAAPSRNVQISSQVDQPGPMAVGPETPLVAVGVNAGGTPGGSGIAELRPEILPPTRDQRTTTNTRTDPGRSTSLMDRGGIIGAMPTTEGRRTAQRTSRLTTESGHRVNNAGGVIGSSPVSAGPLQNDYLASQHNNQAVFNDDDPWAVLTGGPAVIARSTEQHTHTPGSGVIGIDR